MKNKKNKTFELTIVYETIETALVQAEDEDHARQKYHDGQVIESESNGRGERTIQSVIEIPD